MEKELVDETVSLTKELVRIPSENPTGTESAVAERAEEYLRTLGVDVERDPVVDGRENLVAELGGSGEKPTLVFLNHMDTVPIGEGWTRGPFSAEEAEGKIWGRGACDMKGGLAAGLVAMKALKKKLDAGARPKGKLRCCLVVDEESPWMRGAAAAVESGRIQPEDVVISFEPTRLALVSAQKGAMWYAVTFAGKGAHGAAPHMGADALLAAAHAVVLLPEKVAEQNACHSLLGKTTVVTSVIQGGRKTNMVADQCRMEVDVRFVPPLTVPDVRVLVEDAARAACARVPGTSAKVEALSVDRPPILSDTESESARRIRQAIEQATGAASEPGGVSYYSDAGLVAARTGSRNCYLFGPGNIEQAHAPNEYVEISELETAAHAIERLAEQFVLESA